MNWLRKIARQNPAVAPRADQPVKLAESAAALQAARQERQQIEAQRPTVGQLWLELRTERIENHIPDRVRATMRGRPV